MPDFEADPDILTTNELAIKLHLPAAIVRRMARGGQIPTIEGSGGRGRGHGFRFSWRSVREALDVEDGPEPVIGRDPDVLSAEELAVKLGWSLQTIWDLANSGKIPGLRAGKDWRFYWPAIRDRLSQVLVQPNNPSADLEAEPDEARKDATEGNPAASRSRRTAGKAP
jgi:excisionase family DNA binding protein